MQISLVPMPISKLTVYLVLDDLGKRGRAWREIDEARANEQALIDDILSGQYERPLRVVASSAHGEEQAEPLYCVGFLGHDLWDDVASPGDMVLRRLMGGLP